MPKNHRTPSRRLDGRVVDVSRDEFTRIVKTLETVNVTREEFVKATNNIEANVRRLLITRSM